MNKFLAILLCIITVNCWIPIPTPIPTPNPTPTVEPTPTPTPPVTTTTTTTTLTPEPKCPANCNNKVIKVADLNQGSDSTPWCRNDQPYCEAVTGDASIWSCKANPEGSGLDVCDKEFLGATCPIWQYEDPSGNWQRCVNIEGWASCDHFDHWQEWRYSEDSCQHAGCPVEYNPYTGNCQVNEKHEPTAGFWAIPRGKTYFRVCNVDATICSDKFFVDR